MVCMATGGIFQLITNDGKQDRMLMASHLLKKRLSMIEDSSSAYLTTDGNGHTSWGSGYRPLPYYDVNDKEGYIKDIIDNLKNVLQDDIGILISELNMDDPPPAYVEDLSPPLPDYCNDYGPLEPPPNYYE